MAPPYSRPPNPIFFASPAELRAWLEANHDQATELWVGCYKKATGQPSVTYPELVDEALCHGRIDGVRKSIDGDRWMIRLSPRHPHRRLRPRPPGPTTHPAGEEELGQNMAPSPSGRGLG
jgi:uncharacterized protein YdeI (YjbR/CyaY-like superfamily)